ncbi:MAG: hypothetical protein JNL18_25000 [Planctomycetaceae bacterium]|nr:hypothetical protein [Planctomycetaceae bacterium]
MNNRIYLMTLAASLMACGQQNTAAALTIVGGSVSLTMHEGAATSIGEFDAYFDDLIDRAETLSAPMLGNAAFTESPTNPGVVSLVDEVRPFGEIPSPYPGVPGETRSRQLTTLNIDPADILGSWTASNDDYAFVGNRELGEQIAFDHMQRWTGDFTGVLLYGDFALRHVSDGGGSKLFLTSNIDFPNAAFAEIGNPQLSVSDHTLTIVGEMRIGPALFVLDPSAVPGTPFGSFALNASLSQPGDFNLDGNVDGSDFLIWQRDATVGALADWKANFGVHASLLGPVSVIPEPLAGYLLAVAITSLAIIRNSILQRI